MNKPLPDERTFPAADSERHRFCDVRLCGATSLCNGLPIPGQRALGMLMSMMFLLLLGIITTILIQMDKDPVLSRLERTPLGKANVWKVAFNMLSIGGIPLLAVVASQFPGVASFMISWIRPALEALH